MNPIEALKNLLVPGLLEKMGNVVGLPAPQVSQALDYLTAATPGHDSQIRTPRGQP